MAFFKKNNKNNNITSVQNAVSNEEKIKDELLKEIGRKVYDQHSKDGDREYSQLIKAIQDCDQRIQETTNRPITQPTERFCQYCGKPLEDNANFCIFCGEKIQRK